MFIELMNITMKQEITLPVPLGARYRALNTPASVPVLAGKSCTIDILQDLIKTSILPKHIKSTHATVGSEFVQIADMGAWRRRLSIFPFPADS